ncbi:MAG: SUF system NifU family Fe-S cluster assembly protein [Candidatus Aenigmarchaeota archaeon]|nr:SUF system NifU family Fe-S cluster assembly protein [Candidatus Aenigmarchaeota archaeon]
MKEMYREIILERYKNPVNAGVVEDADVVVKDYNPTCGDVVEIQIKFNNGVVKDIKFQGHGCAISQASTDILIDSVKNKKIGDVIRITSEEFLKTLGIELSPLRLKCALLGLKILKTAVYSYLGAGGEI